MNCDKLYNLSKLTRIFILKITKKFKKLLIRMLKLDYEDRLRYTIIIKNLLEKI